ncbi:MAG: hypothetical protein RL081_2119 [Pseudomonadota bacterium]|jgi:diguanylate cyclase (GGDEF)-like protein
MGLRLTLISILSAVMILSGLGMTWVFRHQLTAAAAAADRSGAEKDMERLLLALNQQISEIHVILGSWSNFTSFYEHAARPSEAFRNDDLSVASLEAGHFDWINLIDAQGRVVEHSEVPLPDGSTPVRRAYDDPAMASILDMALREMVRRQSGCAILSNGSRVAIGCYQPLLPSDGTGPARGTVLIGRWVSEAMLAKVRTQTGLQFALQPRPQGQIEPADSSRKVESFQSGNFQLEEETDRIQVQSKVWGMHGRYIADLQMDWPRESLQRTEATVHLVTVAMAVLTAITVLLLIFVCDRLIVRRLEGVRRDLGRILENESWDGRVRTARNDELSELSVYINEMLDIIREKIALVKEQSLTDPLTSLSNRRHFDLQMDTALVQFRRDQSAGALVLFDIDYFKRYNDTYGHPQGDDVLVKFAQCMRQSAKRPMDVLARVGGEEFAILMPMTDSDGASHCAEQVRAAMQALGLVHAGNGEFGCVTVSAGLTMMGPEDTAETLYSRADRALYAAKNSGRNKVVLG